MRLARFGPSGAERPAASLDDQTWIDISAVVPDIDGTVLENRLPEIAAAVGAGRLPRVAEGERFGPPLGRPGKVVCVGLNYRDHATETGAAIPPEPILFLKTPDTIVGPHDTVLVPRASSKTDYEVELAVVIGRTARYLDSVDAAADCVGGFAISHDVSEREFQTERGGQWDKGKNCETFNPFGPWIRTADEVRDPQNLGLRLWVNGVLRQDGTTADMIFSVHHVVWYVSQFMVLRPGDVINSGTPAGVAMGSPDAQYLRSGDVVELEIDGLGRQRQQLEQA